MKKNVLDEIDSFNKIIIDENKLNNEWEKYVDSNYKTFLFYWSPLSFLKIPYLRTFFKKLHLPIVNKKGISLYLNLMRCESHYDLSEEITSKYLNQRKDYMKTIIISPLFKNFMSGRIWMGLDSEKIKNILITKFNFNVIIIPFKNLVDQLDTIEKDSILFYSSFYNKEYLSYIKDTIHFISSTRPDIVLLPNQKQLLALENKGFQEYYKKELGIKQVDGKYYGDINELLHDKNKMTFPFVLKLNEGALSSGVQLIHGQEELINFQASIKKRSLKEKAAFLLNKKNSFKKDSNLEPIEYLLEKNFEDFFQKRKPVVTQAFVQNLECDYKVLVFGEKYFVLRRKTRENDFRASGSGNFEWVKPPFEVLDYARNVFQKMSVPFISFDIGIDRNNECYLFEFQGTAFGPLTLTGSNSYFKFENYKWIAIEETPNLEDAYAYSIANFIK